MTGISALMASYGGSSLPTLVYDLDAATYTGLSASFNGTSQYLSASNAAFTFAGDFTVEGWFRPSSVTSLRTLFTIGAPTAATGALVVYSNGGTLQAQPYGGGNTTFSGATMSTNTWYHIALVRSGSTIKLYFNGTANATTITNSSSIGNGAFTVGFLSGGYGYFAGQISTVRVSASAVYTGNFTSPTAPLTAPAPWVNDTASFNGTSQYFDIASTTAFGFGTADFTIECWWRPTVNQRSDVLDFWSTPGGGSYPVTRFDFGRITSTTLDLYTDGTGGSGAKITGPTIASLLNAWHHIAITRQSGSIKMWVDGTQRGSTYSANVLDMGADMQLRIMGDHGASANGSGNLSNIRVVKDVAVYTGTFTPPTSALALTQSSGTNISAITVGQTQLLLPLNATPFTDSSTNALTVTNVGTVTTSTTYPISAGQTQLLLPLTATPFTDISTNAFTITNTGTVDSIVLSPFTSYDATGTYTMSVTNAGSISWQSANGGVFRKSNNVGTDVIYGGPNYVTGQSYTVFMAYRRIATADGRLLNTQSEASKDWLMGLYNGHDQTFYPNFSVNLPSSGADLFWHLDFATWNTSTGLGQLYSATSVSPSSVAFSATNAGGGGFNQLRLFSRSSGSEVQTADIGFIKVYNGVLTLANVQSLYATYRARFGY